MPNRPRRHPRPPHTRTPGPVLDGLEVLDEIPAELGVVLWQSLRDVALRGAAPAESELFAPGAAEARLALLASVAQDEDELLAPLAVFATVLSPGTPDVPRLVHACRRVAGWAEERGRPATARRALLTAAAVAPDDAGVAAAVGRLWRMQGRYQDSRAWLRHAVALARRSGAHRAHAEALGGLGQLHALRGHLDRAVRMHRRSLRVARRAGLREMQGAAWHGLAVCAAQAGDHARAEEMAARALEAYPAGCGRLPRLARHLALTWILRGRFGSALRVLPRLLERLASPADRLEVLGDLARAAGGAGDADAFERAWAEAVLLLAGGGVEECAARALIGLARGACGLRQWARAEWAAERVALGSRATALHAREAEALLQLVRLRAGPAPRVPAPSGPDALAERMWAALGAPAP